MTDPALAAVNQKLNWLSVAVFLLLLVIDVFRPFGRVIFTSASDFLFVPVLGVVLLVLGTLLTKITSGPE